MDCNELEAAARRMVLAVERIAALSSDELDAHLADPLNSPLIEDRREAYERLRDLLEIPAGVPSA